MAMAAKMPETPEELEGFVQGVVDKQVIGLQRETLEELRRLGERQGRVEGRVEELGRVIGLYREDFQGLRADFRSLQEGYREDFRGLREDFRSLQERYQEDFQGLRADFRSLLERFDHFQTEMRRENEAFRQEIRTENEKFRQEIRAENEKFRQEVQGQFEKIDARFERMEGRFDQMYNRMLVQTRWMVGTIAIFGTLITVLLTVSRFSP
jgi:hypothetical protein